MIMDELKPCPFCGLASNKVVVCIRTTWYVTCGFCYATGPRAKEQKEAIRLWNKRIGKRTK